MTWNGKRGLDQEIREFAEGTFLENADVVVTSAVDGRGIEELRRVLWKLCTAGKPREIRSFPEMKVTAAQAEWVQKHLRFACP
ncbi:MAG: hypothetical protein ACLTER_04770 [Ruminococcus sp.]